MTIASYKPDPVLYSLIQFSTIIGLSTGSTPKLHNFQTTWFLRLTPNERILTSEAFPRLLVSDMTSIGAFDVYNDP